MARLTWITGNGSAVTDRFFVLPSGEGTITFFPRWFKGSINTPLTSSFSFNALDEGELLAVDTESGVSTPGVCTVSG